MKTIINPLSMQFVHVKIGVKASSCVWWVKIRVRDSCMDRVEMYEW